MARDLNSPPFDPSDYTPWPAGAGYIDPEHRAAFHQTPEEVDAARAMVAFYVDMGDLLITPAE